MAGRRPVKTSKRGIYLCEGYCGPMNARAAPEAQLVPRTSPTGVLTQPQSLTDLRQPVPPISSWQRCASAGRKQVRSQHDLSSGLATAKVPGPAQSTRSRHQWKSAQIQRSTGVRPNLELSSRCCTGRHKALPLQPDFEGNRHDKAIDCILDTRQQHKPAERLHCPAIDTSSARNRGQRPAGCGRHISAGPCR
jgi:hypothetical protein